MTEPYRAILTQIRNAFPQPVSDPVRDSYFVHSIMRALDKVDALKSELPLLGQAAEANSAAPATDLADDGLTVERVTEDIVARLAGMPIFGHPRIQQNVVTQPSIPSLIGTLLAALYNPNISWDEYSRGVAAAEVEVADITARLIGYDSAQAKGVFTFGGTGTTLYGVKIGLEKACPHTMERGGRDDAVVFASSASHYCRYNVAGWLGIGANQVVTIPTAWSNDIDMSILEQQARAALDAGRRIAAFVATLGSTDSFGLDDLERIVALRDALVTEYDLPYRPHVHADAVIGWAWSVFNDYDFERNPLGFRPRTVRALAGAGRRLRHLALADSLGVDFHKTGFTPYTSSLFLLKNGADFKLITRAPEQMPYLYQFGEHRPGLFTLETSRPGTGVLAALANLKLFGKNGLRTLLAHLVDMAQLLREHLEGHEATTVLNRDNFGAVTLFRVYPDGVDTFAIKQQEFANPAYRATLLRHNEYNRRVFQYVHDEAMAGRGVLISLTECYRLTDYGEPIVALKSFIHSPFVDEENVQAVVQKTLEARSHVTMDR